jgi:hypothetical protein
MPTPATETASSGISIRSAAASRVRTKQGRSGDERILGAPDAGDSPLNSGGVAISSGGLEGAAARVRRLPVRSIETGNRRAFIGPPDDASSETDAQKVSATFTTGVIAAHVPKH